MKKLAFCLTLAAFAMVSALQAGDGCCPASKSADTKDAQATCPMMANKEKPACCNKAALTAKAKVSFDSSVKGATLLVKK